MLGLDQLEPERAARVSREEREFVPSDPGLIKPGAEVFVINADHDSGIVYSVTIAGAVTYRCKFNKGFHTVPQNRVQVLRVPSKEEETEARSKLIRNAQQTEPEPRKVEGDGVWTTGEEPPASSEPTLLGLDRLKGRK